MYGEFNPAVYSKCLKEWVNKKWYNETLTWMLMQEGTTKAVSMVFLMLCKCQQNLTDNFE
jgi:hypothetical protein